MFPPNPRSPSTSMDVSSNNELDYYVPTMNNDNNNNGFYNPSIPMDYVDPPSHNVTSVIPNHGMYIFIYCMFNNNI